MTTQAKKKKEIYRYVAEYESTEGDLPGFRLQSFKVVKETDKTFWIDNYRPKYKRVPKNATNAYAHATKEAAFEHLKRRLNTRIRWYIFWRDNCERALTVMAKVGIRDFADETDIKD